MAEFKPGLLNGKIVVFNISNVMEPALMQLTAGGLTPLEANPNNESANQAYLLAKTASNRLLFAGFLSDNATLRGVALLTPTLQTGEYAPYYSASAVKLASTSTKGQASRGFLLVSPDEKMVLSIGNQSAGYRLTKSTYNEATDVWTDLRISPASLGMLTYGSGSNWALGDAAALAADGETLFITDFYSTGFYIRKVNINTVAHIESTANITGWAIGASNAGSICELRPDGNQLLVGHYADATRFGLGVLNPSDINGKTPTPLTGTNVSTMKPRFGKYSPNGALMAIAHVAQGDMTISIFDSTTLAIVSSGSVIGTPTSLKWDGNNRLHVVTNSGTDSYFVLTINAGGNITDTINMGIGILGIMDLEVFDESATLQYKIDGVIQESLQATDWRVWCRDFETGKLVYDATIPSGAFEIKLPHNRLCEVTVNTRQGETWVPSKTYAINDKVMPTLPVDTPFYFICTIGGLSDITEPAWDTTELGETLDGQCKWIRVERLIQPITHGPIKPLLISP